MDHAPPTAPQRRGGGYDLDGPRLSTPLPVPDITHPAVAAVLDPARDDKLTASARGRCVMQNVGVRHAARVLQVPYADQGDPRMYTSANLKARDRLRTNPGILDAIKRVR
jgi:hypothetical protein